MNPTTQRVQVTLFGVMALEGHNPIPGCNGESQLNQILLRQQEEVV